MGKVFSKNKEEEDVEEETSDGEEECCGEEASKDKFKGMKKGLKPPSLAVGGASAASPSCVCRDLFVIPLPDPTQVKDLLAKGRVGGDEGETKGEDQVEEVVVEDDDDRAAALMKVAIAANLPKEQSAQLEKQTGCSAADLATIITLGQTNEDMAMQVFENCDKSGDKSSKAPAGAKKKKKKGGANHSKPWEKAWKGTDAEWTAQMEGVLQKITADRELFDRHFAMLNYGPDDVISQTTKYAPKDGADVTLPVCCFFGEIAMAEEDLLLEGGNPILSRHREFDGSLLPGQGPVPTAFPHQDGSKYNPENLAMIIRPFYDHDEVTCLEDYIIVRTVNRESTVPTNQYTVLSYDTFRMDVYGCEALGPAGKPPLAGCCVKVCAKCSYQGQCCKYNPAVKNEIPWSAADDCSKHNPCGFCPATLCGKCANPCALAMGGLGSACCRSFCCGCCDCIAPDPAGPHSIEFRQYPTEHTKAERHGFCCIRCKSESRFSERVVGKLVTKAIGMDAHSAKETVAAIHAAQKAWLKKMDYSIPAAKSFTRFEASSTCGTLLVLDAQDPCFTVYGGNTNVVWAGAELGERSVDYINWDKSADAAPLRAFDMSRNECFTCTPAIYAPNSGGPPQFDYSTMYAEGGRNPAPLIQAKERSATGRPGCAATARPSRIGKKSCETDADVPKGTREWAGEGGDTTSMAADAITAMHEAKVDIAAGSKA